jgi:hypothetical protein
MREKAVDRSLRLKDLFAFVVDKNRPGRGRALVDGNDVFFHIAFILVRAGSF